MKRIFVLSLALILAVSSMVVPSYAAESPWLEVLDYDSLTEYGNYFSFSGSTTVTFDLPYSMSLKYIDMLVSMSGASVSDIQVKWDGGSDVTSLSISYLGNKLYRVYGFVPAYSYYSLPIIFSSSGTSYCTILSLKVSSAALSGFPVPVSGFLYAAGEWKDFTFSGSGQSVSESISIGSSITSWDYSVGLDISNWQNYDFVDIAFFISGAASVNSLVARFDSSYGDPSGTYIPIDFSYIGESFYNDGVYDVVVRIDLSGLDRTSDDHLVLLVDGEHNAEEIYFSVTSVLGYVVPSYVEPEVHFLQKIWNAITSGFSSVGSWISSQTNSIVSYFQSLISNINTWAFDVEGHGLAWLVAQIRFKLNVIYDDFSAFFTRIIELLEGKDAQDMQEDVQDQIDDFDHMDDVINSVTTPNVDNIDTDISDFVSTDQLTSVQDVFGRLFGIQFLMDFVSLSLILGLGSFLVYGRKD